jgi:signal transduction histidine kinase
MHPMRGRLFAPPPPPQPDPGLLLLRTMCHELRTPVASLTSLIRALEAQPAHPRHTELAQLAVQQAAHAEAVLEQAAAAAYGTGESDDPCQPLARILPVAAATVPADRLDVRVSRAAGRRLVHPHHVRQVLINLLGNAARHGPPGGLIRLAAATHRRGLRLTVADGGGLTPDLVHSLHRRTPPLGQKGLGLWVVRHLVATHGGSVRARALSPRGVAVEVTLPRLPR